MRFGGIEMVNDRKGRRTRRLQVLRFFGVLALPVLMLGSAIAVAEWAANGAPATEFARTPATPR
ncbi:hypothetical protein ATC00_01775 [Sinorhizobium americanum]|nr:hypothetical protein ATC00_01775 [Sinorhizobium americanum]